MLIMRSLRRECIFVQKTPAAENARSLYTDVGGTLSSCRLTANSAGVTRVYNPTYNNDDDDDDTAADDDVASVEIVGE